jgi:hypothetical protein
VRNSLSKLGVVALLSTAFSTSSADAQRRPSPSLDETLEWIQQKLSPLRINTAYDDSFWESDLRRLAKCKVEINQHTGYVNERMRRAYPDHEETVVVDLSEQPFTNASADSEHPQYWAVALIKSGMPVTRGNGPTTSVVVVHTGTDADLAKRLKKAFDHAAALCKAESPF